MFFNYENQSMELINLFILISIFIFSLYILGIIILFNFLYISNYILIEQ